MDLKDYIKPKEGANEQVEQADAELLNSLLIQTQINAEARAQEKRRINLWKILAPVITVACAIIVTLTCIFTLTGKHHYAYNEENITYIKSSFADVQSGVKYLDLNNLESTADSIYLMCDTVSNDKLYFSFNADFEMSTMKITVVVNKNYNYNFDMQEDTSIKELQDYTVTYGSTISRGAPSINYKGWIKVKSETLYFDYTQSPALGDEAFFESLQQIIRVKQ